MRENKYAFYGVCGNCFKLDDKIFEAIEDPDDGYRSYLQSVELVTEDKSLTFSSVKLADVKVIKASDNTDGRYDEIIDISDGHVWLQIGTDCTEDYYPCFVFCYMPKVPRAD